MTHTWLTGGHVDRSGMAKYTHLIRHPDDPERSPRSSRRGQHSKWRADMRKGSEPIWSEAILVLLSDGVPRTFNRMMVELADYTADVAAGKAPDRALWALVEAGDVEHTQVAPILFRRRERRR